MQNFKNINSWNYNAKLQEYHHFSFLFAFLCEGGLISDFPSRYLISSLYINLLFLLIKRKNWTNIRYFLYKVRTHRFRTFHSLDGTAINSPNIIQKSDNHGEQILPRPSSFILYQLPQLASSLLHKTPAYLLNISQIYSNKFSPILTIKATKRPVSSLPAWKNQKAWHFKHIW